eukprot:GEMP01006229.1.p1 GENE.GEMP01006229.1~~GEMP01006229.1.p1  ORF type:complete len:1080 (+),score=185.02 GEMP01006229.1:51-3290(+)
MVDPITARLELFEGDRAIFPSSSSRFICATFSDSGERLPDSLLGDAFQFDRCARDSLQVCVQAMPPSAHCVLLFYRLAKIPRIDQFTLWIDSIEMNGQLGGEESVKSPYALFCGIFARELPPNAGDSRWYFLSRMESIWRKNEFLPEVIYRQELPLITHGVTAAVQKPGVRCVKHRDIGVFDLSCPKKSNSGDPQCREELTIKDDAVINEPLAHLDHMRNVVLENFEELVRQAEITANVENGYLARTPQARPAQNPNDAQTPTSVSGHATNDDQRGSAHHDDELRKQCGELERITLEQQVMIQELQGAMERMVREKETIIDQQQTRITQLRGQVCPTMEPSVREEDAMIRQLQVAARRAIDQKDVIIERLRHENAILRQRKNVDSRRHVVGAQDRSLRRADSRDGSPPYRDVCPVQGRVDEDTKWNRARAPTQNQDEVGTQDQEEARIHARGGSPNDGGARDRWTKNDGPHSRNSAQEDTEKTDGPLVPPWYLSSPRNYNGQFTIHAGSNCPLPPRSTTNSRSPPRRASCSPTRSRLLDNATPTNAACADSPPLLCAKGNNERHASSLAADRGYGYDKGPNSPARPQSPSPDRVVPDIAANTSTAGRRSSRHGAHSPEGTRRHGVVLEGPRGAAASSPVSTHKWNSPCQRHDSSSALSKQSPRSIDDGRLAEERPVLDCDDGQKVGSSSDSMGAAEMNSTVDSVHGCNNASSDSSRGMDIPPCRVVHQGMGIHPSTEFPGVMGSFPTNNTVRQTWRHPSSDSSCTVRVIPSGASPQLDIPSSSGLPRWMETLSPGDSLEGSGIHPSSGSQGEMHNRPNSDFSGTVGSSLTCHSVRETWPPPNNDSSRVMEIIPSSSPPRAMGTPSSGGSVGGSYIHLSIDRQIEMIIHPSSDFPPRSEIPSVVGSPEGMPSNGLTGDRWIPPGCDSSRWIIQSDPSRSTKMHPNTEMHSSSNPSCAVESLPGSDSTRCSPTHPSNNSSRGTRIHPSSDTSRDAWTHPSSDATREAGLYPGSDASQCAGIQSSSFAFRWAGMNSSSGSSHGVADSSRTEASTGSSLNDKLTSWRDRLIIAVNDAETGIIP